jgi:hypothetical protein
MSYTISLATGHGHWPDCIYSYTHRLGIEQICGPLSDLQIILNTGEK